jgi:diaminopimelate decarboxylase
LYAYDLPALVARARELTRLSLPFGCTARYAVKANPHPKIIRLFNDEGLHFDASSSYEAENLLSLGIAGPRISLSSQQPPHNLEELLASGVQFVATSLHQLRLFAAAAEPGAHVALRVNVGVGSGHNNRTTTAGVAASFGLWHEHLEQALELAQAHRVIVDRLHTHIGSGADSASWAGAVDVALNIAARMPDVTTLDMGGGYKVKRAEGEHEADMQDIFAMFSQKLQTFYAKTGRRLHLEIEPGTWLVAHAGTLIAEVVDIVDTGTDGYTFLRTNTGMNDFMRPTLYGAQHCIRVLNDSSEQTSYVVVGHNCESGDILTPASGDSEHVQPRLLNRATIGDLIAIEDVGAYGASLRAVGYNAFPAAKEVFVGEKANLRSAGERRKLQRQLRNQNGLLARQHFFVRVQTAKLRSSK